MAEFFLDRQSEESNIVHRKECATILPNTEFRYLGSFAQAVAAFDKAIGFAKGVTYCPDCIKS